MALGGSPYGLLTRYSTRPNESRIGNGSVIVGLPNQLGSVGQQLLPNIQPRTTVKVREGAEIAIFVARDLDFGGTPAVGR